MGAKRGSGARLTSNFNYHHSSVTTDTPIRDVFGLCLPSLEADYLAAEKTDAQRSYSLDTKLLRYRDNLMRGVPLSTRVDGCFVHCGTGMGLRETILAGRDILQTLANFETQVPAVVSDILSADLIVLVGRRTARHAVFVDACAFHAEHGNFSPSEHTQTQTTPLEWLLGLPVTAASVMWSFGCLFAWMLTGTSLFASRDPEEQLVDIMRTVGVPPLCSAGVTIGHLPLYRRFLVNRATVRANDPEGPPISSISQRISQNTGGAHRLALVQFCNLLTGLLDPNPSTRTTATHALKHSLFSL
jgi:serine/threonine protein kinase